MPAPAAAAGTELSLTFNDAKAGSKVTSASNAGSASFTTTVIAANGGQLTGISSRPTQAQAIRFPAFDASSGGRRAVLAISNAGSTDNLNPGSADFSWGADFKINSASYSKTSTSHDNGDNLVQRGLSGTKHQYKLELDSHHPACTLQNSTGGKWRIRLSMTVSSAHWYRATCARVGQKFSLTVARFASDGTVNSTWSTSRTQSGGFGSVRWSNAKVPLTVGGKLNNTNTKVNAASDQFNGRVDNVFFDVSG